MMVTALFCVIAVLALLLVVETIYIWHLNKELDSYEGELLPVRCVTGVPVVEDI